MTTKTYITLLPIGGIPVDENERYHRMVEGKRT
jgi:hypothetical protein